MGKDTGKFAAIDIGTNSTLLLIAELSPESLLVPITQKQTTTRLGKGLGKSGVISREAQDVNIATLKQYQGIARKEGIEKIVVSGTQALRMAENGREVTRRIETETGLMVKVLSSDEEARLSFKAAATGLEEGKNILLVDIGGGSTELILGAGQEILKTGSFPVGAVNLTEKYLHKDPIDEKEFAALLAYIHKELQAFSPYENQVKECSLLGVAGTITTLAEIDLKLEQYDADQVHGHVMDQNRVKELLDNLRNRSLEERKKVTGLKAERADIIVAGAAILHGVMEIFKQEQITVSDRGLRYGLIMKELGL